MSDQLAEDATYVCSADTFDDTDRVLVELSGIEIAIFRIDGDYYGVLNYCVHQGGPLCEGVTRGKVEVDENFNWQYLRQGEIVTCPWHGYEFDIKTGDHVADTQYKVPTFEVFELEGDLFVTI